LGVVSIRKYSFFNLKQGFTKDISLPIYLFLDW
jgi:hypothetical protein